MALGFYINNANCYGCKTCVIACKSEKQLNKDVLLREVTSVVQDSPLAFSFVSMACNHCEEPVCLENCPVGAYTKLDNGIIQQNHDLCIGCMTCVNLCPYGAPDYDDVTGKTFKCDMCIDRQNSGLLPACVASCPGSNLGVGEMDDLQSSYPGAIGSEDESGMQPHFVISVDPLLAKAPYSYTLERVEKENTA